MGELGFYEASAQVIPVLFIVLAVEWRAFDIPRITRSDRFIFPTVVLMVIVGEFAALHALYLGDAERVHAILVWWADGLLGVTIAAITAASRAPSPPTDEGR